MRINENNKSLETFFSISLIFIFSFLVARSLGFTMLDDGWRHLSMGLNKDEVVSWGRVFAHSLYTEYDPWFMWHKLISFIASFIDKNKDINTVLIINTFSYFFLALWYYLMLIRYSTLKRINILLLSCVLPLLTTRYLNLRPDILSGLFVLYALLINNKSLLVIISLIYMPFYYVFWFFVGYIGYMNLFLGKYKEFIVLSFMMLFGFCFHLFMDFEGYVQMMQNVLNNDVLIGKYLVSESSTFAILKELKYILGGNIKFLLILMILSWVVLYLMKPKKMISKFLILLMPLMLLQFRFLLILMPVLILYSILIIEDFVLMLEQYGFYGTIDKIIDKLKETSYIVEIFQRFYKEIFTALIALFFLSAYMGEKKNLILLEKELQNTKFLGENEFKGKKVLITHMGLTMQFMVFFNPSGSCIPNCSLGWVDYDKKMKDIYFKIIMNEDNLKKEELFEFIKFNDVDYFIVDKFFGDNIKFRYDEIEKIGYRFYRIMDKKIVFQKINYK